MNDHQRVLKETEHLESITSRVIAQSFKTSKNRLVNNVKEKPLSEYTLNLLLNLKY